MAGDSVVSNMLHAIVADTHQLQIWAVLLTAVVDTLALVYINQLKARGVVPALSWTTKRLAYWTCIVASLSASLALDAYLPIGEYFICVKMFVFAFPLGLLDLLFSQTDGVPMKILLGAVLWCCAALIRVRLIRTCVQEDLIHVVDSLSPAAILKEYVRYLAYLPSVGLFGDLIFSPMHRLAHLPATYKDHHKTHHTFTNNLTGLVLFHGALLDDFLMPVSTAIGGFIYVWVISCFGLQGYIFSNFVWYMNTLNLLLSHAHDIRCSRLMVPLPEGANFVAYHYNHHLNPNSNFGLTKPSDMLWDKLLGQNTVQTASVDDAAATKSE